MDSEKVKQVASEFAKAVEELAQTRTGALLVFERETPLTDIIETGTIINSRVSAQLVGNIFYEGAPLHDGAVIVKGEKLYAAGCVLPLTQDKGLNKALGTRHRAGIGVTENSDALTIIVSEETGIISMAEDGNLTRFLDPVTIEQKLLDFYSGQPIDTYKRLSFLGLKFNKKEGDKDAEK